MFRRQFQRDLNGLHERLRDAALVQEETLSLRIASIFIVALVSLLGCILAVAIRCKEGEDNMTHRLLKCLAGGVIAGVGFVHVLAESSEMLGELSPFPWAHVVAMFGAFLTLLLNQVFDLCMSKSEGSHDHAHTHGPKASPTTHKDAKGTKAPVSVGEVEVSEAGLQASVVGLVPGSQEGPGGVVVRGCQEDMQRVVQEFSRQPLLVAYVMELGIVFHSVLLGLGMGVVSADVAAVRGLLVAVCVHQFFEGAGLATCIMEAQLDRKKVGFMLGFFSLTTPLGIAIGIGASRSYDPESTTALAVQGTLNALAAGILIYLALVDMVAHEFSSAKVRGRVGHQAVMFLALMVGAIIMTGLASFE